MTFLNPKLIHSQSALWSMQDIAELFASDTLAHSGLDKIGITGISINTRTLNQGDLFIALKGPLCDGHDYLNRAYQKGAVGALVQQINALIPQDFTQIVVDDTDQALRQLARHARNRAVHTRIIGITGSFGKTTTREALKHILSQFGITQSSERNFNNHWGVPLSVAHLHADTIYGIYETGINHPGEMQLLAEIIQPHIAIVTTIGDAHIGNFGQRANTALAKSELFSTMCPGGTVVLNHDIDEYQLLAEVAARYQLKTISFGMHPEATCRILETQVTNAGIGLNLQINDTLIQFSMTVFGEHWAHNMAGVLLCVLALGLDIQQAAHALQNFKPLNGRGLTHKIQLSPSQHILVIDESYNGGPQAMQMAVTALSQMPIQSGGRRVAVLGEMTDLGKFNDQEHEKLGHHILNSSLDQIFLYGKSMKVVKHILQGHIPVSYHDTIQDLNQALLNNTQDKDCILIKGAHNQRAYDGIMYQVVECLQKLNSHI